MMNLGVATVDITPRVGVELTGFGPFLNRHSRAVRSPLLAKALALEVNGVKGLILNCELIGISREPALMIAEAIAGQVPGLSAEGILISCTHTHSGPNVADYSGWGETDPVYAEILNQRLIRLGVAAFARMEPVSLAYGTAPCEHIGLNREYDRDAPPLEEVLQPGWRPAMPERTDTVVQVLRFDRPDGSMAAFCAYFGCHPVVCCQLTFQIHGDYPAIALVELQQEFPGSTGIFLQGAQGDVNSCVVHKPEAEALAALTIVAARFAVAVRAALAAAQPVKVDALKVVKRRVKITPRRTITLEFLRKLEQEQLAILHAPDADDDDFQARMATVMLLAARRMIGKLTANPDYTPEAIVQGFRLGDVELLASPFEVMQEVKNEIVGKARAKYPLVVGLSNGSGGYAPSREIMARQRDQGGYTTDTVPLIVGELPFEDIHTELVNALLEIDAELQC